MLLWSIPLVAALLLAVAGGWAYVWLRTAMRDRVGNMLQTVLRADVQALSVWLEAQGDAVEAIARDPGVLAASQALVRLADRDAATLRRAPEGTAWARRVEASAEGLSPLGYGLLDRTGRVLGAQRPQVVGRPLPTTGLLLASVLRGETVIDPPHTSSPDVVPALAVMTGIRCEDGTICAVLRFRLRPDDQFTRILNVAQFGESGETYAFNAQGVLVSESRFLPQLREIGLVPSNGTGVVTLALRDPGVNLLTGARSSAPRDSLPLTRMARDAVTGRDGLDLDGYRDYRGVTVVGAWTWLPRYGIGVATEVDLAEAYAPLLVMRRALAGPLALVLLATVLALVVSVKARALRASLTRTQTLAERQDAIMRTVFESVAEGVVVGDEHGRFLLFNPAAERMAGLGRIDEPYQTWPARYGLFLPDTVTPMAAEAMPMIRALRGEAVDDDLVFIRNQHQPEGRFISVSARPMRAAAGAIVGAAIVFRDVTESRRAEEAIRRLNLELGQKVAELSAVNSELEAFSYSVSHDLRAPVRHIQGFVSLLKQRLVGKLDDTSSYHLGVIGDAATQMSALIDGLLTLSRAGRADMQQATVDLEALVREAMAEVKRDAEHREIDWRIGSLPAVRGDRALLRIAFVNLLSNAVKYSQPRARAIIEVGVLPPAARRGTPEPASLDGGAAVVLFVRDNGVGFDPQYADRLFGVFQRLHEPEEFEGTGIGLATVRRIIHRHGGRTWAEAAPDEGATFYVTLPLASVPPSLSAA